MPTKTSVGPNEVVRLEVLRLAPPLEHEPATRKFPLSAKGGISRQRQNTNTKYQIATRHTRANSKKQIAPLALPAVSSQYFTDLGFETPNDGPQTAPPARRAPPPRCLYQTPAAMGGRAEHP
jgi:hypothetical protein